MLTRSLLRHIQSFHTSASNATWIMRRVVAPEPTPPNAIQRDPRELHISQRLEIVEREWTKPKGTVKVILLRDVEGIGHQFDVLDVPTQIARTELLTTGKAAYASPFDLKYYGDLKEKMKDELAARVRIPFEYLVVARQLQKMVVQIRVNMDNPWTIDSTVVKVALRLMGVDVVDDSIFVPSSPPISGPNFDLEANLIRFYVVIGAQYVVPMLGQISHISADETKQMLNPEVSKFPTDAQLAKYGLKPEECYYHPTADISRETDVFALMKSR